MERWGISKQHILAFGRWEAGLIWATSCQIQDLQTFPPGNVLLCASPAPACPTPSSLPGSSLDFSITDWQQLFFVSNNVHPSPISCFYTHNVHTECDSFHIHNCKHMAKPWPISSLQWNTSHLSMCTFSDHKIPKHTASLEAKQSLWSIFRSHQPLSAAHS